MRSVTVELGEFAVEALAGEREWGADYVPARMVRAIRIYLGDREAGRPGWPYPGFLLRGHDTSATAARVNLELDIEEELWGEFEAEAARQGVSVQQLGEHAALYLAAEVNAGHITERILDDFEEDAEEG